MFYYSCTNPWSDLILNTVYQHGLHTTWKISIYWKKYNTDYTYDSWLKTSAIWPKTQLRKLGLWSLKERRNRADLLQTFRIYKGRSTISFDSMFAIFAVSKTRGHSAKIVKNRCCLDIRHHFFSERVINRWNRLDQHVIDSATLNAFKSGLERTRNEKIGFSRTDGPPSRWPHLFIWI